MMTDGAAKTCPTCGRSLRVAQLRMLGDPSYQQWCREGFCSHQCYVERANPRKRNEAERARHPAASVWRRSLQYAGGSTASPSLGHRAWILANILAVVGCAAVLINRCVQSITSAPQRREQSEIEEKLFILLRSVDPDKTPYERWEQELRALTAQRSEWLEKWENIPEGTKIGWRTTNGPVHYTGRAKEIDDNIEKLTNAVIAKRAEKNKIARIRAASIKGWLAECESWEDQSLVPVVKEAASLWGEHQETSRVMKEEFGTANPVAITTVDLMAFIGASALCLYLLQGCPVPGRVLRVFSRGEG